MLEVHQRILRSTPREKEIEELNFDPKPRKGKKEASTSQNSPSVANLTRQFQTLPRQHQMQGTTQGFQQGATQIQQLIVQIPIQDIVPTTTQQQVLVMAQQWRL